MKFKDINKKSLREISNSELVSLHRRVHQVYGAAKKRGLSTNELTRIHSLIVDEMEKRRLRHQTPLNKIYRIIDGVPISPLQIKVKDVKKDSVKKLSNRDLVSMHHHLHDLYGLYKKRNKNTSEIIRAHNIIANEMISRGMNHNSPLYEQLLNFLSNLT